MPGRVKELASLYNAKSVDDYKGGIQALLGRLPLTIPSRSRMRSASTNTRRTCASLMVNKQPLFMLANWLDRMCRTRVIRNGPIGIPI